MLYYQVNLQIQEYMFIILYTPFLCKPIPVFIVIAFINSTKRYFISPHRGAEDIHLKCPNFHEVACMRRVMRNVTIIMVVIGIETCWTVNSGASRSLQREENRAREDRTRVFFFFERKDRAKWSWQKLEEKERKLVLCVWSFFFQVFIFRCGICYHGACLSFPSWLFFHMLYFILFRLLSGINGVSQMLSGQSWWVQQYFFLFLLVDDVLESKLKGQLQLDMDKGLVRHERSEEEDSLIPFHPPQHTSFSILLSKFSTLLK